MADLAVDRAAPGRHAYARVVRAAARGALADFRTIHTPVTWAVGWLGRIIMQVVFFALIGRLLEDEAAVRYLFVGQAVLACAMECHLAIQSTTWERRTGTLALLVAAPGPLWPVFVGRSLQWLPSGTATASIVLLAVGPIFGVTWTVTSAAVTVGLLALAAGTTYGLALTLASLVLRRPRWRNVVANVATVTTTLVAGVAFPAAALPGWLQVVGQAVPLTHALAAVREVQAGTTESALVPHVGAAVATGLLWFVLAVAGFTVFGERGRRDGSIDLDE